MPCAIRRFAGLHSSGIPKPHSGEDAHCLICAARVVPEMRFKRTRLKRKGGEAVYTPTAANTNTNQEICANRV